MTARSVQTLRHVGFEDLGSFEAPLRAAGYDIEYVDVAERDPALLDPLSPDLLVVLGGPIGVYDDAAYPVVTAERTLLDARLKADRPTLGICLGAQLMAAALGSRVYPGPAKEIGWSALELAEAAKGHPIAALEGVPVLHWHGDARKLDQAARIHRWADMELASEIMVRHGQWILKYEWNRVKLEAASGKERDRLEQAEQELDADYAKFLQKDGSMERLKAIGGGKSGSEIALLRSKMDVAVLDSSKT